MIRRIIRKQRILLSLQPGNTQQHTLAGRLARLHQSHWAACRPHTSLPDYLSCWRLSLGGPKQRALGCLKASDKSKHERTPAKRLS